MPKYKAKAQFIVNGVDMSSYVQAVEVKMVADNVDRASVTLVGHRLQTSTDEYGRNVIVISIGDE